MNAQKSVMSGKIMDKRVDKRPKDFFGSLGTGLTNPVRIFVVGGILTVVILCGS